MTLLDINFTSYIPTSLLGLLGLISGYLFFYFKNKSDNKLKEIQSVNPEDRVRAIEMSLNELGVTIDTSTLNPEQKFKLIKDILRAKLNRYLIISITLIIISLFITFLIWKNKNDNNYSYLPNINDTINTVRNITTQEVLKAPPDIDEPESTYPELYDGKLVTDIKNGGSGCELNDEDDTVVLVRVVQPNDADASDGDYVLQDKNGVQEKYFFNAEDLSEADKSWINTVMVVGRRLRINYAICGHGGYRYLTDIEPLKYYSK